MLESIRGLSPLMVYVLLFLVTLFAAYLLIGIGNFFKKLSTVGKGGRPGSRLGCMATVLLLVVLFGLVFIATLLGPFHSFSKQELAAIVQCQRTEEGEADFDLYLVLVRNGVRQDAKIFSMQGNVWALEGEVLQWGGLGRSMGLNSMYRFAVVESRHTPQSSSGSRAVSQHPLSREEKSGTWNALRKLAQAMPFFTISKYATDYVSPNFAGAYEVEVSQSGFTLHAVDERIEALSKSDKSREKE